MAPSGWMGKYMNLPQTRRPTFETGDQVRVVPGTKTLTDNIILDGESFGVVAWASDKMVHVDDDLNGRIRVAHEDLILIQPADKNSEGA